MTLIFNKNKSRALRKMLRNNMPKAEYRLWYFLKKKERIGYRFRRQVSVGSYVVDFYCPKAQLAIEVDGDSHFASSEVEEYDKDREANIRALGIRVLRFTNTEVYEKIESVIQTIDDNLRNS